MYAIIATMKHPKFGNKSFLLLGLTLLLGAFLTVVCNYHAAPGQNDLSTCELIESDFDVENQDSDFSIVSVEAAILSCLEKLVPSLFVKEAGQVSGNSFVPIFLVPRRILYLKLQLHH